MACFLIHSKERHLLVSTYTYTAIYYFPFVRASASLLTTVGY
jgi:hypothetical protein